MTTFDTLQRAQPMNMTRVAAGVVTAAVLYLVVPMAVNLSTVGPWIVLPTALSFLVFAAAAYACARLAEAKLQQRRPVHFVVALLGALAWCVLLYVTLSYCPV